MWRGFALKNPQSDQNDQNERNRSILRHISGEGDWFIWLTFRKR